MRIALIAEKPHYARSVIPVLRELYPAAESSPFVAVFVNPGVHLNGSFAYPRGLGWEDYPYVGEPAYRSMKLTSWMCARLSMNVTDRGWPYADGELPLVEDEAEVVDRIRNADVIMAAMNWHPGSALTFRRVLDHVFPEGAPLDRIAYPNISDQVTPSGRIVPSKLSLLFPNELRKLVAEAPPLEEVEWELLPYAMARRRFDYSFNVNAFALLRRTMSAAGIPSGAEVPTKYGVQFLYALNRAGSLVDDDSIELMRTWKGSGKYRVDPTAWTRFGSERSWENIIDRLVNGKLVERFGDDDGEIRLSKGGERFLSLLHPDCEDPDMHFRLDAWCKLPVEESYPKIDRYIRTFFGKQKRHVERYSLEFARSDISAMRKIDEKVFGTIQENANTRIVSRGQGGDPVQRANSFTSGGGRGGEPS